MEHYQNFSERYQTGNIPWDNPILPPEVMNFVPTLTPTRALDLGCGPGRNAIYLAQQGWKVDAVDFVPQAIEMAQSRAKQVGVSVNFFVGDVTDLSFLNDRYDLALDIGCLHGLPDNALNAYYRQVASHLRPGGRYLIFARLRTDDAPPLHGPPGVVEDAFLHQFKQGFTLNKVEYGTTQPADGDPAWDSAWFWFTRNEKTGY